MSTKEPKITKEPDTLSAQELHVPETNSVEPNEYPSSGSSVYDDVFRTLQIRFRRWMIPLINVAFGEHYTGNEEIIPAPNEHFLTQQDGNSEKRITDSYFAIVGKTRRNYHIECQSNPDGSMLVRMFEYDSQIALENAVVNGYGMSACRGRRYCICVLPPACLIKCG